MSIAGAQVEPRSVPIEEMRLWVQQASALWKARCWKLAGLAFIAGGLLRFVPAPLELVSVLILGPSALWMLVVTADPMLGPDDASAPGPLPAWVPGAIRVVPLGLLVASIAMSLFFATALLFAAILLALGIDPNSVKASGAVEVGQIGPVRQVVLASGVGASLIVFGALSLLYARGFGLFVKAALKIPTSIAVEAGRKAWQCNAETMLRACRTARLPYLLAGLGLAAMLFVLFVSGIGDPAALLISTYIPCLFAAAFRSVFPGAVRTQGVTGTTS